MCYDISFTVNISELADYFPGLIFDDQVELQFGPMDHIQGVSVFAKHPIIYINRHDMQTHVKPMEWSCIEYYAKTEPDFKKRNGMLNIRAERILGDPKSYWNKIKNRRCLIPVTGIYEHREVVGWKNKVPYIVKPADQPGIFFLPGLYSVAELPDKETGELIKRYTFGLITRAANSLMKNIHNSGENRHRMPLFLPLNMSKEFLSDDLSDDRYRELLDYEIASDALEYFPVNTIRTPKQRPDGKGKHEYWSWDNLPELGEKNPE
jgi:putative SOS response-associated peptidase YedK